MKARWGVGPLGALAILATFALAGSSVLLIRPRVMDALAPSDASTWLRVVIYIAVVFPIYQVLLLGYGALFGKLRFFLDREKQLFLRLKRLVLRSPAR